MAQEKQGNEVGSIAESRPGWLTRQLGDFKEWRKVIEAHPLKGAVLAIVLLVLGILGNEAVDRVMQNFREPDEFLVQMKDEQKQNFEALNATLSDLKGTPDADGRSALSGVASAADALQNTNARLTKEFPLAKRETTTPPKRLSHPHTNTDSHAAGK